MTENTFIALFNENKETYNNKKANLEEALDRNEAEYKTRRTELVNQFAKFKVGDVVNRITEKFKVPRKYIITEVSGDVNYRTEYERDENGKVIDYFGHSKKVYYADIRYHLMTVGGYEPNGRWPVSENELKLAE